MSALRYDSHLEIHLVLQLKYSQVEMDILEHYLVLISRITAN